MAAWEQTYADAFGAFIDRLCGNAPKQPEPVTEKQREKALEEAGEQRAAIRDYLRQKGRL